MYFRKLQISYMMHHWLQIFDELKNAVGGCAVSSAGVKRQLRKEDTRLEKRQDTIEAKFEG